MSKNIFLYLQNIMKILCLYKLCSYLESFTETMHLYINCNTLIDLSCMLVSSDNSPFCFCNGSCLCPDMCVLPCNSYWFLSLTSQSEQRHEEDKPGQHFPYWWDWGSPFTTQKFTHPPTKFLSPPPPPPPKVLHNNFHAIAQ